MSDGTHIEWTDASWNPIRARTRALVPTGITVGHRVGWQCQRVSPGCQNCYAEAINKRLGTGLGYDAKGMAASEPFLDERVLLQPLHWRKPRKVFVCSMTDIAGEWVPDEWLDRMFAVMALTPQHTYQVLTKRPRRLREYLTATAIEHGTSAQGRIQLALLDMFPWREDFPAWQWPLPNVWIGTSVEDQERADERIPELLATPAAVRFLSCEPLLGAVWLNDWLYRILRTTGDFRTHEGRRQIKFEHDGPRADLHWVIVGGESGPGARPMDLAWARSLVAQCQAAGVAVFVKQLGARPVTLNFSVDGNTPGAFPLRDRKGGSPEEWPEDLRVREWPRGRSAVGVGQ